MCEVLNFYFLSNLLRADHKLDGIGSSEQPACALRLENRIQQSHLIAAFYARESGSRLGVDYRLRISACDPCWQPNEVRADLRIRQRSKQLGSSCNCFVFESPKLKHLVDELGEVTSLRSL